MSDRREFAILFSHASTAVWPELVSDERFADRIDAAEFGQSIVQVQGVEYEIMEKIEGQWRSGRGESPQDVIRRRWSA
ncbi:MULTISPECIES: hypothetical protein [Mycobacterium]|uniref:Uncharacterized protein n=4 Tax=Mycobacterium TaxID=1763 RepID=A0AAW5SAU0_MYCBC|nr:MULTISPECIES: hypothetical protein [Mycobacterium]MBZ4631667.1 hypothetical protein [Mycobacterium avium subsp. hominissuis]MCV6991842.1 hypothetical protein [Mycobacterium bouchedurhonense]MCV6993663.1 hypothetical protein [Mycobacterium timonense]ORA45757.1 hypothetical protein BST19_19865 [Mycobacterium bouchedurhonense]ORW04917.1 hypothetical protein AWC14_02190 [Mycobacterium kyorinense]